MNFKRQLWLLTLAREFSGCITNSRLYSSKVDLKKLRPMILKRIEERKNHYPIKGAEPVANEVLMAREILIRGISTLVKVIPLHACKFCPEVYIGEKGHLIQTCCGYKRLAKNRIHEWIPGTLTDILVPVEAFHLKSMFQDVIKHHQRFDSDRVPAVLELCWQAGADRSNENLDSLDVSELQSFSYEDIRFIASETLKAYETLRLGVQKLLLLHPARVCKHCSEVHVGPTGHKARLCGIFKYEAFRGSHFWRKAMVDDFVPSKIVWRRRSHDPLVLLNEGRGFYGHAPAVVELCTQVGVVAPSKYFVMMKAQGLSPPV